MDFRDYINLVEETIWDEYSLLFELFDMEKFLSRAKGVQALIVRGGTEGERDAAREAMERMLARAKEQASELSSQSREEFWRRFDAIRAVNSTKAEPASARRSNDNFYKSANTERPKPDQAEKDAQYGRQRDSADAERQRRTGRPIFYGYAEYKDGTSDKVYGMGFWPMTGQMFTFWGRNGGSLASKIHPNMDIASEIFKSKLRKGYRKVNMTPDMEAMVARNLRS